MTVAQKGGTATYTVVLVDAPTDVVTPSSDDTDSATVSGALAFTADNWDTAQTVMGEDDNVDDRRTTAITHTVASTGDSARTTTVPEVAVTVTDDDTAVLALSVDPNSLAEGASATAVTVTATLSGATLDAELALPLTLGGTAQEGVDYTVSGTLPTITIVKGGSSATARLVRAQLPERSCGGSSRSLANHVLSAWRPFPMVTCITSVSQ